MCSAFNLLVIKVRFKILEAVAFLTFLLNIDNCANPRMFYVSIFAESNMHFSFSL